MVTKTINPSNENTGTSGTLLQGQGIGTASAYTTATYPATTSVSQILYSSSANVVGGLTTANGGVLITSNTGVPSILAGSGTSGQVLQAVSGAAPAWSTPTYPSASGSAGVILRSDGTNYVATSATYPATTSVSQILYSSSANVVGGLTTANGGVLITSNTGVPSILAGSGTSGQVLQAVSGAAPAWSTPTYPSASGSAGVILRSDGTNYVATTNTFPNTSTTGDILIATGTNVIGSLADVAVHQVLVSGGVGVAPAYSATPTVTSITFGAGTALSVYAEGTWTPALAFGGSSTGITYAAQSGVYVKIGKMVFCSFVMFLTSKGSQTGSATITGLPFTVNAGSQDVTALEWSNITFASGYTVLLAHMTGGATTASLDVSGSNKTAATSDNTYYSNTSQMYGSLIYYAST